MQQEVLLSSRCKTLPGQYNYRLINFTRAKEKAHQLQALKNLPWILGPRSSWPWVRGLLCWLGPPLLKRRERCESFTASLKRCQRCHLARDSPPTRGYSDDTTQTPRRDLPFSGALSHRRGVVGEKLPNTTKNPSQTRTNQTNNKEGKLTASSLPPKACPCLPGHCAPRRLPRTHRQPRPLTDGHSRGHHGPPAALSTHRLRRPPSGRPGGKEQGGCSTAQPTVPKTGNVPLPPPFVGAPRSRARPGPGPGPHSPRPLLLPPPDRRPANRAASSAAPANPEPGRRAPTNPEWGAGPERGAGRAGRPWCALRCCGLRSVAGLVVV